MNQKLHPEELRLLKIIGLTAFAIVSMYITFGIGSLIHEGGHACACIALGGNVGGFRHWLRGAWSLAPATDCSLKPFPPFVWAGGDIATILGWLLSVVIPTPLLHETITKRGVCASILWGGGASGILGSSPERFITPTHPLQSGKRPRSSFT